MMKRLITLLIATFLVCSSTWANEEFNITLEKGDVNGYTKELPYGNIYFRLIEYGYYYRVNVSIENTTMSQAILVFKYSQGEKELKKNKPKVEFKKTYPGGKGNRNVYGCKELNQQVLSIIPQEKANLFEFDVSATSITKLELPIYLAEYNPKQLTKKGSYNINYKILSEDILSFNIEIKGWDENDPEYVAAKGAVEDFLHSIQSAAFCKNKKHKPSLAQQQKPYQEKKDSLINVIQTIVDTNDWMSDTAPYQAYKALRDDLDKVNLNDHNYDCGGHSGPGGHSCNYCSLSAQQIYHRLDDMYQLLRAGKLTKDAAVKEAQGLNNCYKKNKTRKKDSSYTDKISRFYSRIISY